MSIWRIAMLSVRDPAVLANRMRMIMADAARPAQISSAARQTAENYAWPLIADRLLKVFEDVVQTASERRRV